MPSILKYLNETVEEFNLKNKIRFGKYSKKANWSSSLIGQLCGG